MIVSIVAFHLYCMIASMVVYNWLLGPSMLCQTKTIKNWKVLKGLSEGCEVVQTHSK